MWVASFLVGVCKVGELWEPSNWASFLVSPKRTGQSPISGVTKVCQLAVPGYETEFVVDSPPRFCNHPNAEGA